MLNGKDKNNIKQLKRIHIISPKNLIFFKQNKKHHPSGWCYLSVKSADSDGICRQSLFIDAFYTLKLTVFSCNNFIYAALMPAAFFKIALQKCI